MTERRSRIGLDPPPRFFADVISYLRVAFPQAKLAKDDIERLRSHLVRQWRMGQTAARAAASTCSCDGNQIVPSAASGIYEPPPRLRPPLVGADMSFGYDQLREPRAVEQARVAAEIARRHLEHYSGEVSRLTSELKAEDLGKRTRNSLERMRLQAERQVAKYEVLVGDRGRVFQALPGAAREQLPGAVRASESVSVFTRPEPSKTKRGLRKKTDEALKEEPTAEAKAPNAGVNAAQSGKRAVERKVAGRKGKDCKTCESGVPPEPIPSEDLAALQSLIDTFADEEVSALSRKQ